MIKKNIIILTFLLYATQFAYSINLLSFDYSGLITDSFIGDVSIGDSFSGKFSYDLDTINEGMLSFNSGILDFSLSPLIFEISDNNVGFDYFDIYALGPNMDEFFWFYQLRFYGPDTIFSNPSVEDALNMVLNGQFVSNFIQKKSFALQIGSEFYGEITDLKKSDNIVPEPMTFFLYIISCIILFGFRKRVI